MADREVPEDFAAFVTRYGHRLADACRDIAGNDRVADAMRVDLLAAVALGWRWRPARWRVRHALAKLDHLLRREVRSYRLLPTMTRQIRMSGDDDDRTRRLGGDTHDDVARLADAAWRRAGVLRRRGWLGVATAVLVLIGFALISPEAAPLSDPSPDPTATPNGVTVLAPFEVLVRQVQPDRSPLPSATSLDPAALERLPQLQVAPLERAIAVVEPNRGHLIVIGEGAIRRVDDPVLVGARLVPTSLSPAGDRIALPNGGDLLVIDVRSGTLRPVEVGAVQTNPPVVVWHTDQTVLVPGTTDALEVDVVTGAKAAIVGVSAADVVTVEGNPEAPLVEMLSSASIGSQRSRIRYWRSAPDAVPVATAPEPAGPGSPSGTPPSPGTAPAQVGDYDERPVSGPSWVGDWNGVGVVIGATLCSRLLPSDAAAAGRRRCGSVRHRRGATKRQARRHACRGRRHAAGSPRLSSGTGASGRGDEGR